MENPQPADASRPRQVQHRLIVKFAPDANGTEDRFAERAQQLAVGLPGGRVVRVSRRGRVLIAVQDDADLNALAEDLSMEPGVEYAEPDVVDRAV